MSTENDRLDSAELVKAVRDVEGQMLEKFKTLEEAGQLAAGQAEEFGKTSTETQNKIVKMTEDYDALYDKVKDLEQKGAPSLLEAEAVKTPGHKMGESDQFKAMADGRANSARISLDQSFFGKTAIVNATGAQQPLVPADRDTSQYYANPDRVLRMRGVIPSSSTSSNLVEFTREDGFTNAAAPTVSGSPETYENVTKPESAITFSLQSAPVITLAHWIPASKQVLSDAGALSSHIDGRLMYGLKLKEEDQLLNGTGINHQLGGLCTTGYHTDYAFSPFPANNIDAVRTSILQCQQSEYFPDFLVLNPLDWYKMEIKKVGSSDDRYVIGDPSRMLSANIWGLPVVVTNSMTAGKFLMGSRNACEIMDREGATIEVSREDQSNFVKNMVTVLAEERLTFVVYRTEAFIHGDMPE